MRVTGYELDEAHMQDNTPPRHSTTSALKAIPITSFTRLWATSMLLPNNDAQALSNRVLHAR